MPFKSKAQRAYLYANMPALAAKWQAEYPSAGKGLPARVKKKKGRTRKKIKRAGY